MKHSKFTNDGVFIEFLNQNGIPAILSSKAGPDKLHWWEFEKIKRITDVAILKGHFFLAVTEQGFRLHVHNGLNDWYNLVRIWKSDVSEAEYLQDLKRIDIYSFDSHVWFCVRETYFEFEWQREIRDFESTEQISLQLKEQIFRFHESFGDPKKLKREIVELLTCLPRTLCELQLTA